MRTPVLCIRNDRYDNLGIAPSVLAASGLAVRQLDGYDRDARWPSLDEIGGLIVFGGAMNVDEVEAHPYLSRERKLMLEALDRGLPVLGICLGAQMLARALGARVHRAPVRELGFKTVELTGAGRADPLLSKFGSAPRVFQWHEDTFELPEGAELLATGGDVANQAFRYGERAWGVQFHFEVNREGIDAWLNVTDSSLERVWKRTAPDVKQEAGAHLELQERQGAAAFAEFGRTISEN